MPMDAVRCFFKLCKIAVSPSDVFRVSGWLDMAEIGIHATARSAAMIAFHASRDRSKKEFINVSVKIAPLSAAPGVAILIEISQPQPAAGVGLDVNLGLHPLW